MLVKFPSLSDVNNGGSLSFPFLLLFAPVIDVGIVSA
jgi:hypothetical protein